MKSENLQNQFRSRSVVRAGKFLLFLALLTGCASRRVENVEQMSQAYKVGITRFDDFKRDARLVEVQIFDTRDSKYATLKPSHFEIIDQIIEDHTCDTQFGGDTNQVRSLMVGDASGKTCLLRFHVHDQKLISISVHTN